MDLNNCSFTGNLVRNVELKSSQDGSFAVFTIAVNSFKKMILLF
jgi:hypothetical protein